MSHHVMLWIRYLNWQCNKVSPECTPERLLELCHDYEARNQNPSDWWK